MRNSLPDWLTTMATRRTSDRPDFQVWPATTDDLRRVLAVERLGFGPDAWSRKTLARVLGRGDVVCRVGRVGTAPAAGFLIYHVAPTRYTLLNLAVDPDWRRCGVASALLRDLLVRQDAHLGRRYKCVADVHVGGLESTGVLLQRHGFTCVTRLCGKPESYRFLRFAPVHPVQP